jgi:PKD repeat protein
MRKSVTNQKVKAYNMRKLFVMFSFLWITFNVIFATNLGAQTPQVCCPDFELKDAVEICPAEGACAKDHTNPAGSDRSALAACKESVHVYTVYPNDPSFTYTWTVTGGTPTNFTGNPNAILWGTGSSGLIKVVISNLSIGGNCLDSISMEVCLIDGPEADFTFAPNPVCKNTPVNFVNTSLGGSTYLWDFGDGTTFSGATPPAHSYSTSGSYTVTLTATDMGAGQWTVVNNNGQQMEMKVPCGCTDTISKVVVVLAGEGPKIETDCCFGTVCPGDTTSLCTPTVCTTYNWSVTGGTIVAGLGTNCIKVKWDAFYTVPTTVTLSTPGCGAAPCPGTTTINVPVLYPNLPISGPSPICVGSSASYSLPLLPGTYYNWTTTAAAGTYSFNKVDRNSPSINISFTTAGTDVLKCDYNNPLAGCSGSSTIVIDVLPVFSILFGDEIVCEGSTTSYFANGAANWTITPPGATISGNGTSNITVTWPNAPGAYTIVATPPPGSFCNLNAFKNVQVKAKPVLGSILGSAIVCPNIDYTYKISSNVTGSPYFWTISSGTGTILSEMGADKDSVIVKFTGTGPSWTISVYQEIELSPGVYCQSLTKNLTVTPFPTSPITGNGTVCIDAIETYSIAGPMPPDGYQWEIVAPNQNRGTIQSGQGTSSVTIQWHGTPTTVTLKATGCSGFVTKSVTINGLPSAVVSYNILPVFCLGGTQTLILSTPAGFSYQWYRNGSPIAGGASLSIPVSSFTIAGTYQYYVVVTQNGCSKKSNIVNVVIEDCTPGTPGGGPVPGQCPVVSFFRTYVVCNQVTLVNKSYAVAPATISSYLWSVTGPGTGTFSPNATSANPTLSVTASGTYVVTLKVTSSTGCFTTWSETINVFLPTANFTFTTPVCANSPATFTANPINPLYNYAWNFGDGSTSFTANTQHAYSTASPPNYTVTLVITNEMGCTATKQQSITVNPTPACTISVPDTMLCPGDFKTFTASCTGMSSYQWYKNGNPISGANSNTYNAYSHGKYWVVVTNSFGCSSASNKISIYMKPQPKAQITGDGSVCAFPASTVSFPLLAYYDANYNYNWYSVPAGATFSPNNTNLSYNTYATITVPAALPVTYQFILEVTDMVTFCKNNDTLCITFFETPPLTVTPVAQCEGTPVTLTTLTPPINPAKYKYKWNTGQTTPTITVSAPGFYSLTITDKSTGCSNTADAGLIFGKPDLRLFPTGCKDICTDDTLNLYIPLPLNAVWPNNTYPNAYPLISWFDNGSPIGTGNNLPFTSNTPGTHQFSVVVQNSFGCVDSTGALCLTVAPCDTVVCTTDFGDAPENANFGFNYQTTLSFNGAYHFIVPTIYLGSKIDPEWDGQPTLGADGDDINGGPDDEDGVIIPPVLMPGSAVAITVLPSVNGFLDVWIDYNQNGLWGSGPEHVFISQAVTAPSTTLTFTVPAATPVGNSYARFRFRSYSGTMNAFGGALNGEVEDYAVHIGEIPNGELDFGDAPENSNTCGYPTTLACNGARHLIVPTIYMGTLIDPEINGQQTTLANGDDTNGVDDEDGVTLPSIMVPGLSVNFTVNFSVNGFLDAWVDFNQDGNWAAANEHILTTFPVTLGLNSLSFTVPLTATIGNSYARFRFRDYSGAMNFDGIAQNGEVEDYPVYIGEVPDCCIDFGDAPSPYPTLIANNGAGHINYGLLYLGSKVDNEPDGQPQPLALGDDNSALDDEDGVQFVGSWYNGGIATVKVQASGAGFLNAWMDFNMNGSWAQTGEQVFTNTPLTAGINTLTFNIPASTYTGATFMRFRFSSQGSLSYTGLAIDGEVEDYKVDVKPNWLPNSTNRSHLIAIPADISLIEPGDVIGVFYTDNQGLKKCGGFVEWMGDSQVLVAFGDDVTTPNVKEGFASGESFIWRLHKASTGVVNDVNATYDFNLPNYDGTFADFGFSAITSLFGSQTLSIPMGWSGISTYVSPVDDEVAHMFSPIVNSMVILYNFEGYYWPSQNVNTLGKWNEYSGYVIKLTESSALNIYGPEMTNKMVNLEVGWSIVPVLSTSDVDIVSMFEGVTGFYAAKDVAGQGVYWPKYNFNTIGNMKVGKSYFVYMTEPGSITYPDGSYKTSAIEPLAFENVTPWNDVVYTPVTHLVAFENGATSGFENGDIIAAFTPSGLCAGMNVYSEAGAGLTLNGDDMYSVEVDGFVASEDISYKLYRPSSGETFELKVTYDASLDNTGKFNVNSMSAITEVKMSATGIEPHGDIHIHIYPNPTQGVFTIEGMDKDASIRIFNAFGEEIFVNTLSLPGKIDLTGHSKGVYFISIETAEGKTVQKLVIN